jgi:asparagine synthase (glutamine-hydrolysing)
MCGIAGILSLGEPDQASEPVVRRMLAMLRHRGPDEFGILLGTHIALGSARLSIIDLSTGQQPISNEDGTLWIVFNGEVFNYLELRAELEARGHRFSTHTDTEVIVHLYEEYGPGCLSRLNGQFAIAIWNERDRTLFLARDRVGVRPLFYARLPNALVFASEIKSILTHPQVRAEWDPVALDQVFTYWSTLSPRSCFAGVHDLPPGHYLLAGEGRLQTAPYWQLRFPDRTGSEGRRDSAPVGEYVEKLRSLLVDATNLRLRADVPVGAYLSGGLDSSTIAAIIRRFGPSRLDTFSIAFSDPKFDESEFQRRMAKFLGTEHQVVYASHADIGRVFPDVIWHTETPILRTAPAPMFLLSKLVRDRKYKVVLTGEGADEFLCGYDIFKESMVRRFWARRPESSWRPLLLKKLYPDIGDLAATGGAYLKAFFKTGLTDVEAPYYSHAIRWRNSQRASRFFSEDLRCRVRESLGDGSTQPAAPAEFARWGTLERAQYLEVTVFLSQYLLSSQGDRMGMANSIEGRFPFLDHRVVEFCSQLPSRLKLNGMTEKYLLRQVAKEWLPEEIWTRGKRPYRAPIQRSFFNESAPEYLAELLSERELRSAGLFDANAVSLLIGKLKEGKPVGETDEMALVGIISTQLVHQQFVARLRSADPLGDRDRVKVVCRRGVGLNA